jgi:hypothetical protein
MPQKLNFSKQQVFNKIEPIMNENDLIKRFRELEFAIPNEESKIKYVSNPENIKEKINQLKFEKNSISDQLKNCKEKPLTIDKLEKVKSVIIKLYNKFSKTDYPYKFSRDQGMIIYAYILIKIADDINNALDYNASSPQDYYLDKVNGFDITDVVQILKKSIEFLDNNKINDYIELYNFVRSIQRQIVSIDKECGRILTQ